MTTTDDPSGAHERVAYLVNQYPAVSHTFIRREIQALESLGLEVRRYAVRTPDARSDEDRAEAALTRTIVDPSQWRSLTASMLRTLRRRPVGALGALLYALRLGARSDAGLGRHFLYWLESLVVADWMLADRVGHVHAHFGTNGATVAMLAAPLARGGFSVTVHGPEEFDKPEFIHLPEKIRRATFVAAISSYGVSQLRRLVGMEYWDRIRIVRCGLEAGYFAERSPGDFRSNSFVCVGRLAEQKGHGTLVAAAAILKRRGRDFRVRLVGDGEMRAQIEAAISREGLGDIVSIGGWATPAEVRNAIFGARAFVLPSYAEGLPVSIMEAFALQTPVVTTYVAGVPELVEHGVNGWLAPAADADALAEAMEAALDAAPETLAAMGADGQARVRTRHAIAAEAARLKALFQAGAEPAERSAR